MIYLSNLWKYYGSASFFFVCGIRVEFSCGLFPLQNKSQPTKNYLLWEKKVAQMPLLTHFFSWVGLALVRGVARFHNNIYMFSNPIEFGESQNTLIMDHIRSGTDLPRLAHLHYEAGIYGRSDGGSRCNGCFWVAVQLRRPFVRNAMVEVESWSWHWSWIRRWIWSWSWCSWILMLQLKLSF